MLETDSTAGISPRASREQPKRLALLVGISVYRRANEWPAIHGEDDLPVVAAALERRGFDPSSIQMLAGPRATKRGILRAIRKHLLEPAKPGDVLWFHFSGHGQRILDQPNGDELDGYDETLVPWEAPRFAREGYRGELHLLDDELDEILEGLRRRVGARGMVVVTLDSCFSGTGTRASLPARGSAALMLDSSSSRLLGPEEMGSGLDLSGAAGDQGTASPLVVFSATSSHRATYEVQSSDGTVLGALSRALASSLNSSQRLSTYRDLFDDLRWQMISSGSSEPVAEGDLDFELFGKGVVEQGAVLKVVSVEDAGWRLIVQPGTLVGLAEGAEVEVHRPGALRPEARTFLTRGTVSRWSPTEAEIQLEAALEIERSLASRVFVTRFSFGDLRLGLRLEASSNGFSPRLPSSPVFEWVTAGENLVVEQLARDQVAALARSPWQGAGLGEGKQRAPHDRAPANGGRGCLGGDTVWLPPRAMGGWSNSSCRRCSPAWRIWDPTSGDLLAVLAESYDSPTRELARYLWAAARNRYLRKIQLPQGRVRASFDIVPADFEAAKDPHFPHHGCSPWQAASSPVKPDADPMTLPVGTCFRIRVRVGPSGAYLTLLDLRSDGGIGVMWPPMGYQAEWVAGNSIRWLGGYYSTTEPTGLDQLLLVASLEPLDFLPFAWPSTSGTRSPADWTTGPFAPLFDEYGATTRSRRVRLARDEAATASDFLRVVPAAGTGGGCF